jgi:hypothetical protein
MSACMRSLYSSDQWAPGFPLALPCACGRGGVLLSLADFRAATFSLSVTRDDVGLEDEFELFMQFVRHLFPFVKLLVLTCAAGYLKYWIPTSAFLPCGRPQNRRGYRSYCT